MQETAPLQPPARGGKLKERTRGREARRGAVEEKRKVVRNGNSHNTIANQSTVVC